MFNFDFNSAEWFCKPEFFRIEGNSLTIKTEPGTDLWQRTYYGFRNDNAHILYVPTDEKFFSFTVKASFDYGNLFDQCGISIYQDSDNWVKAGIEFHDGNISWLGSVVTNNGYSDWATTEISSENKEMWYRISRREKDFCIENSIDGKSFSQMRIFHFFCADESINIGLLACSPQQGAFKAVFSDIEVSDCLWDEHNA